MLSIIRIALEDADKDSIVADTVQLTGPLANSYTEALNIAFSKDQPIEVEDAISHESFASQQGHLAAISGMFQETEADPESNTTTIMVYAVGASGVNSTDVKNISSMLANGESKPNDQFVVITDTSNSEVQEKGVYVQAVESLVEAYNVKMFNNLPTFLNSVKKR